MEPPFKTTAAALCLLGLIWCGGARAADQVTICYNYDCAVHATVTFTDSQMKHIKELFRGLPDAAAERAAIGRAIGLFETFAGEQTPTYRDKGGDENDDGVDGRMDCIDHAHNSTAYLRLLERDGYLRFHRVLDPVERAPWLVNVHWAALIEETASKREYVVDSWFFDNGHPAVIFDLGDWKRGARPHG